MRGILALAIGSLAFGQGPQTVPLTISEGAPLRLYLTKRLPKRLGQPVEAKLLEPLFAFDRMVVPAGTTVLGRVDRLDSVPRMRRAMAIVGGDFTPLHEAQVTFDTLVFPDGHRMPIHTVESIGLNTIFPLHPPKPRNPVKAHGGVLGIGKRRAQEQIDAAKERVRGIGDMVRGPDKKQRLAEFALMKLPYHPQWVRNRTRFDAPLSRPLDFGMAAFGPDALRLAGTQPPPDSIAHVRLLTPVDSASANQGDPIQAVLTQPLLGSNQQLILPEGTIVTGAVTLAHRARWFHRGGRLRFNFQRFDLPPGFARSQPDAAAPLTSTQASLASAESNGKTMVDVDSEGGVKAREPKAPWLAPLISFMVAGRAADNDSDRVGHSDSNVGGRTVGGFSGFGLLGAAAAQSSHTVGAVLGYYGLAWSVYSNLIARGSEVEFGRNAAMDIRFGARITPRAPRASMK